MVKNHPLITGAQLRAARALLNLTATDLADETKVGLRTIGRAEREDGPVRMTPANADKLRSTLEAKGIAFVQEKARLGVLLSLDHHQTSK